MEAYSIQGTHKTPTVVFDPVVGIFEIAGRSIPEDPIEFYQPLVDSLNEHTFVTLPKCEVTINLEYFNTSSSRCIFVLLKTLAAISKTGSKVSINWMYEVEDVEMLEAGEDFQALIEIPFKMVPVSDGE